MPKKEHIDKYTDRTSYNRDGAEYREYEHKHESGRSSFEIYTDKGKVGWSEQELGESRMEARDRAWDRATGKRKD
nr:hypothetical protein [Candidatus Freyarchaeota archaeon]